jgi:hypothetical protein
MNATAGARVRWNLRYFSSVLLFGCVLLSSVGLDGPAGAAQRFEAERPDVTVDIRAGQERILGAKARFRVKCRDYMSESYWKPMALSFPPIPVARSTGRFKFEKQWLQDGLSVRTVLSGTRHKRLITGFVHYRSFEPGTGEPGEPWYLSFNCLTPGDQWGMPNKIRFVAQLAAGGRRAGA